MDILLSVHQFFPNHYTGTERMTLNLAKQLQRQGHKVTVLTYGINDDNDFEERDGFLVKKYNFEDVPVISIRHQNIPLEVSFLIFDPEMEKPLFTILKENSFNIIHVCHPMRTGTIIKVANAFGIPVILTLTDFWLICPRGIAATTNGQMCFGSSDGQNCITICYGDTWSKRIEERFSDLKILLSKINYIVFPTDFLKKIFLRIYSGPYKIIRFGIDQSSITYNERKYSPESDIFIGYLSSILRHKGADILIRASISADQKNLNIKIYGDPAFDQEYFAELQKISSNGRIEFCGKYSEEEMGGILGELDLVAIPSRWWENTPLVMLKALAHHVPVIVSDFPGMTEIVQNEVNGYTFQPNGINDLKNVLLKIAYDPTVLNSIKENTTYLRGIEEEAFEYECLYFSEIHKLSHAG